MTLIDVIERWAEIRPEATAYTAPGARADADTSITYRALLQRARGLAAEIEAGVAPGERLLVMMPNGIGFMLGYLASLVAGTIAVPVPVPRPRRTNERLKRIIRDCAPAAAIVESAERARSYADALGADAASLRWLSVDQAASTAAVRGARSLAPDAVAMLQYTSGSTASPKGVKLTHGNLLHNQAMIDAAFGLDDSDVILGWLPLFHDMGLIGVALHPLYKGIRSILLSPESFVGRPLSWLRAMSDHGVTISGAPDFAYELCARLVRDSDKRGLDLSRWRIAFSGSERVRPHTLTRFEQAFADCGFRRTSFLPCYGMAEATLMISAHSAADPPLVRQVDARALHESRRIVDAGDDRDAIGLVGVGRTLPGETIVIVEPEAHRRLAEREVGEVWVAGPSVSEGCWGSAEDTRVRPSWDAGREYLRTGDLGFMDDGELFITGRLKDLIIIRGRNLHPEDVETAVEPCLADAASGRIAAFSVEVDDEERLVVAFEASPRRELTIDALAGDLRTVLGQRFEVELHALVAVKRGSLPLTSSGKLRRNQVRALWSEQCLPIVAQALADAPADAADDQPTRAALARATREEARSLLSEALIDWIRGLGGMERTSDRALRSSSLPGLGLGSLQIIRLIHRIDELCGVRIALADSLEAPSLDALVDLVAARLGEAAQRSDALGADDARVVATAPLSLGQQGIWFAQQLSPRSSAYQIARAAEVFPAIDVDAMNRALTHLVRCHPALRLAIDPVADGQAPTQRVAPDAPIEARVLSYGSQAERDRALRADARTPFDLSVAPLLRVSVLRAPGCRDLLALVAHHVICDLWSLSVLMHDLFRFYREALAGGPQTPARDGPTYLDHVLEERSRASTDGWRRRVDFWKRRLGAAEDWTRSIAAAGAADAPALHAEVRRVDRETTRNLRRLARRHGMSLQMVLFAAFQVAVAVLEGGDDLLACMVTSGRERADRRRMVGYFANLLLFLVRIDRRDSAAQWLGGIRRQMLDAYANELPCEEVIRSCVNRHAHERPVKYAFVMQDEGAADSPGFVPFSLGQAGGRWTSGGIELASVAFEEEHAHFPLALHAGLDQGGLLCCYKAAGPLVTPQQTHAAARLVERVLEWLAAEGVDDRRLSELRWLDPDEQRLSDERADVTRHDAYLQPQHLLDRFERQCVQTPDRIALEFEDASATYAHLQARVLRMASHLRSRGVGRETIVGVCMHRSIEMVVAIYGVLKAGGAYLPLDPEHPAEYLETLASEAGLRHVVSGGTLVGELADTLPDVEIVDVEAGTRRAAVSDEGSAPPLPDQLAYVIFTSGSTGVPKGAMNTHAGIVNRLSWMQDRYRLDESDVLVQKTPFGFDVSVWELFWPLMVGARLVIARPRGHRAPGYLADLLAGRMVTLVHFVPSMLRMFLLEERCVSCRALRTVICSGEALPTRLVRELAGRLPVRIENLYGPTEASVDVTCYRCDENWPGAIQPIGQAIANIRLHVVDAALQALPVDVTGALFISGVGLARGYLANPALTAERFLPDPFGRDGGRFYDTGDRGRFRQPDLIEFCGRRDGQVKLRGLRIELSEVEAVLERHESILAAAVTVRQGTGPAAALRYVDRDAPAPQWGPLRDHRTFLRGELATADAAELLPSRLVAYCVGKAGAALDVESIQQWVRARLPEGSVPAAVVFLEQMPVNASGKLDKARLPEPDSLRPSLRSDYCAPRNARERSLADAWERVLDVRGIGIRDNFFALGGDSIRALRLISNAGRAGIVFDLATLFARPTIAELADCAATAVEPVQYTGVERFSLISPADRRNVPDGVVDAYPLAAVQAGLIFHDEAAAGSEVYKDVFVYRIRARFDEAAFRASVATLLDRHEILRSSIDLLDFSVPMQLVHPHASASVEVRRLDDAGCSADTRAFVALQRSQAFDWSRAPFLRFAIGLREDGEFELFVIFHDLLLDGWSASQLVSELLLTYDRLLDGNVSADAPPLRVRFADYIASELEAGRSAEAREFFATYLAGAPEHRFPVSEPDDATVPRFAVLDVPIPLSTSERLEEIAATCGVGIKHVLLAAHMAVMSQLFGERDILTGLESNGRLESEDGEMVLGMHLNTVPFRVRCAAGRWRDLIGEVYRTEQVLMPMRRYPYANMQRMLGTGDLVDTVFNYVHFHGFRSLMHLRHLQVKEARGYGASHFKYRSEFSTDPFSGRIHLCLECDTRAVAADLVYEIGRYFARVLDSMAADVNGRYGHISLAQDWLPPVAGREPEAADVWLRPWQQRLDHDGDRIALVHGQRRLSFTAVQRRAHAWAGALARRGVGPERCVGILARDPIAYSIAILAIHLAGGAYVPMNPRHPAERNRKILTTGGIAWVIVDDIDASGGAIAGIEMISPSALDADACRPSPELRAIDPDQSSYVIYTSGSTGTPKGVMVTHRNLWFSLESRMEYYARPEPMVFLMIPPFAFDSSVGVFFWSLAGCHRLVFPETDVSDLLSVLRTIREEGVTHVLCTPSYYGALLAEAGGGDLQSLDTVIMAGEPLSTQLVSRHAAMLPRAAMFNEYGPTEGTVWSTVHRCGDDAQDVPVGTPRGYTSARILDRRQLAATPGQSGELVIGGAGVARGYVNAPAATAAAFVPDASATVPGGRAYRTGDLARAGARGAIHLLGRNDRQVKINGHRVELDEIEHAIRQLPAVEACAVVHDARAGGPARIIAYVVATDDRTPDLERLDVVLPTYMVPGRVLPLGTLPLNANGKVDYRCLRDRGEQLSDEWQTQRILDEVERMTKDDVISALARVAGASPAGNSTHDPAR